jgi:hypothetical protein
MNALFVPQETAQVNVRQLKVSVYIISNCDLKVSYAKEA